MDASYLAGIHACFGVLWMLQTCNIPFCKMSLSIYALGCQLFNEKILPHSAKQRAGQKEMCLMF